MSTQLAVRSEELTPSRRWSPLVAICLGSVMLLIDVSIVNVALPQMALRLHASFSSLQWVIDAYALMLAALLLGVGSLADLAGHRRTYIAGLLVFAAASVACGLAPNAVALDVARGVQGAGAAAMLACTTALLNSTYRGADRGAAFGIWGAVSSAATAVGPVLGGLLVQFASWRWIFIVNVPLSGLAIVMTARYIAADAEKPPGRRRLDRSGITTFIVFAASLTYALIRAGKHGWATPATWVLAGCAVVALAAFLTIQTRKARTSSPMLDLSLFRNPAFTATMVASALSTLCAFATLTYSTIWLQTVIGLSPVQAGLTGLPLAAASFAVSMVIGRHLHRGPGPIIASGMLIIGLGSLCDALLLTGDASWPALIPGTALTGIGAGLVLPTLTAAAMAVVPPQLGGMAAGALSTVRQLGFALGIAALGSIFTVRAASHLASNGIAHSDALAGALASGQTQNVLARAGQRANLLDDALHEAALAGLDTAFIIAAALAAFAAALVYLLTRPPHPRAAS